MTTVTGTKNAEEIDGTKGDDTLNGLDGTDLLVGLGGNDQLNGGNDSDALEGGLGNDRLDGGAGLDVATYITAKSGVTVSLAISGAQNTGGAGTDTLLNIEALIGSKHDDVLTGNSGSNILDGGAGRDSLSGGAGDDLIQISMKHDAVAGESYDGGKGYDTFAIASTAGIDLSVMNFTGFEKLAGGRITVAPQQLKGVLEISGEIILNKAGTANLGHADVQARHWFLQDAVKLYLQNTTGVAHDIAGSKGSDTIYGGNADDDIVGGGGDDVIVGGSGDDQISSDANTGGTDRLSGGGGDDTIYGAAFSGSGSSSTDILNGGAGNDVIYGSSIPERKGGGTDFLSGGDGNDKLVGSVETISVLDGGDGNDELLIHDVRTTAKGDAGTDTLTVDDALIAKGHTLAGLLVDGGDGNDTLSFGNHGPGITDLTQVVLKNIEEIESIHEVRLTPKQINELPGLPRYLIIAGPGNVHTAALSQIASLSIDAAGVSVDLTAVAHNIGVAGSKYADVVIGGSKTDTINGNDGDDVIDGGAGNDAVHGGKGDDRISGADGDDTLEGEGGSDFLIGGAGNDRLFGSDAADTFDGGKGNDQMYGGAGIDTVTYADADRGVQVDLGHRGEQKTEQGTDILDGIENLIGSNFADEIIGGGGDNVISGLGGDDRIIVIYDHDTALGGTGNDTLVFYGFERIENFAFDGGDDEDTLEVHAGDTPLIFTAATLRHVEKMVIYSAMGTEMTLVDENIAAGETLTVSVVAANKGAFDPLNFDGAAETNGAFNIVSSVWNDTLVGGAGADIFQGGRGADHLTGGGGGDIFVYTAAEESAGLNYDTIIGADFAASDVFSIGGSVQGTDAAVSATLSTASFNSDLAIGVGAGQLAAHHALLFTANSGTLSGQTFLVIDMNGTAGYQATADLVIRLDGAVNTGDFDLADFS